MLGLHDDGGILGAEEIARIVDACDEVEILLLHLRDGAGAHDARVGEHEIEPAEELHGFADHRRDALLVGYVDADGDRALAQLPGHLGGQRLVHVGDDDRRAFFVQLLGDASAEALRRAGDNGDPARQAADAGRADVDVFLCELTVLAHID